MPLPKTLWALLFLLHKSLCHEVTEQLDDIPNNATTTLYPVPRPANASATSQATDYEQINKKTKLKTEATVWKVETAFAESKLAKKEDENSTELEGGKNKNGSQEFKPSHHLGDFFDFDSVDPITFSKESLQSFKPMVKKPSEGFKGFNYAPKKFPTQAPDFPYKFDSPKGSWRPESKDPWSSAWHLPDPFGEAGEGGDFGADFKGELAFKEHAVKKRANPWKGVVQMLTALIPTAIIVSALTPTIINVDHMRKPFPTRLRRRVTPPQPLQPPQPPQSPDPPRPLPAPISERCRRRLLCELQAEEHYQQSHQKDRELSKSCRRHRCEDPSTLAPLITWLLQPRLRTDGATRGNKLY